MATKLVLSGLIISLGLLLGRLMGFVREISVASIFGATSSADIAVLALTIPDVLVSLLVAGGLSAALIPEFKTLAKKEASILFLQASTVMATLFSLVAMFLSLYPELLVALFAPGLADVASHVAQPILAHVIWLIPLAVLSGVTTAYLQAQGKFAMPAMGTLIFNACVVMGLLLFVKGSASLGTLVYFILFGGLVRWLSQLWVMRQDVVLQGCWSSLLLNQSLLKRYAQAVVAIGLLSLFPVVARAFASFSGEGGVAMMNYAWKLVEFPLGLVITVLSVVLFPKLSEMHVQQDMRGFTKVLQDGLTWSVLLAVVIMIPVSISPDTFVGVVFGWGSLSAAREIELAVLLAIGILILPFQAVIVMAVAACNAQKKTHIPMRISIVSFVVLLLSSWLMKGFDAPVGVMLSLLLTYIMVSGAMLLALHKLNEDLFSWRIIQRPCIVGFISFVLSACCMTLDIEGLPLFFMLLAVMCLTALFAIFLERPSATKRMLYQWIKKG